MSVKKIESFLISIIKTHDEHEGKKNRHLNHIYLYHTNHDPHLTHCWKRFCLLVFDSPFLRKKED